MSLAESVERIRFDLAGLQSPDRAVWDQLHSEFAELRGQAEESSLADLTQLCQQVEVLVAEQALGEVELSDSVRDQILAFLDRVIEYAGAATEGLCNGDDLGKLSAPEWAGIPREDPDSASAANEDELDASFYEMFISGCMSTLADLEAQIVGIEAEADSEELIAEVRRAMHTLKGECGVLSLSAAQELFHEAESTIDVATERGFGLPTDTLLGVLDWLKSYLSGLEEDHACTPPSTEELLQRLRRFASDTAEEQEIEAEGAEQSESDVEDPEALVSFDISEEYADTLPDFISEARSHLLATEGAMLDLDEVEDGTELINQTFRAIHTIKGVAGFINLTPIVKLSHVAETLLDGARSGEIHLGKTEVDLILSATDMLSELLNALEGGQPPRVGELAQLCKRLEVACQEGGAGSAHPDSRSAERASEGELVGASAAASHPEVPAAASQPQQSGAIVRPEPATKSRPGVARKVKAHSTVKVGTDRLDLLIDMVGELLIAQSMVLQHPVIKQAGDQNLNRSVAQVARITKDLQSAAMSLRMVTVKATFQKMARLVRDVAGKSGKQVRLHIAGEETELDRNVVEEIADPLVHMIRNAVDHGIEVPQSRVAAGKPAEGNLYLEAYHQGGSIVIEVRDDGHGLDREKILQKALERELLPAGVNPADLSDSEVFNMIFLPGFSTAAAVTEVSGRGVGMDVVRRNIESLRGKVEIESTLGNGSTFYMRLPLTLAIIDGMVVLGGNHRFIIPTLSIAHSFRPTEEDVFFLQGKGEVARFRDNILPVYRLRDVFDQTEGTEEISEGMLLVLESNATRTCLLVDEILGQQQVVIKSLGVHGSRIRGVSGGAIMGDGRVALIIDVAGLVDEALAVEA